MWAACRACYRGIRKPGSNSSPEKAKTPQRSSVWLKLGRPLAQHEITPLRIGSATSSMRLGSLFRIGPMARSGIEPDRPNVAIPSLPSIHVRCEYGIAGRITGKNPRGDLPVIHDRAFVDSTAILCGQVLVHENVLAQRWVAITVLPMNPVCMVATGGAVPKVRLKLEPRGGCHAIHHTDTVAGAGPV